jgi:hypothetical protein
VVEHGAHGAALQSFQLSSSYDVVAGTPKADGDEKKSKYDKTRRFNCTGEDRGQNSYSKEEKLLQAVADLQVDNSAICREPTEQISDRNSV